MSTPKRANDMNMGPCWKVRVYMKGGGTIHLLSKNEPVVEHVNGEIKEFMVDLITNTEHGDTIGFIDFREIAAATWRFAPLAQEK